MKIVATGLVIVGMVGVAVGVTRPDEENGAQTATVGPSATDAPKFRVDPAWPTIPNNWQFGQVASVSVDMQDHVWILQRPGTLAPAEKSRAAPPVQWKWKR